MAESKETKSGEPVFQPNEGISIRLTHKFRNNSYWERTGSDQEILVTGDRVVQVDALTAKMSEAIRGGVLESGHWAPSEPLPDLLSAMEASEAQKTMAEVARMLDQNSAVKRARTEAELMEEAEKMGLRLVRPGADPEKGEYEQNGKIYKDFARSGASEEARFSDRGPVHEDEVKAQEKKDQLKLEQKERQSKLQEKRDKEAAERGKKLFEEQAAQKAKQAAQEEKSRHEQQIEQARQKEELARQARQKAEEDAKPH